MGVLNQALYNKLTEVFGEARVHNEGDPFLAESVQKQFALKKGGYNRRLRVISPGEFYSVCCPFCGDTRFRLWFNHMWNVRYLGQPLKHMVYCYNEGCHELEDFRETMDELLSPDSLISIVRPQLPSARRDVELDYPGEVIKLTELPADHSVLKYLTGRGLDIEELTDYWKVRWITSSGHKLIFDTNRLVFPVYTEGRMMAWQTRWFDYTRGTPNPPRKSVPKYLTQGNKNRLVYNLDGVKGSDWVLIGEGVMDAIKAGPEHGVCIFGKRISQRHAELIYSELVSQGTKIILALDPDLKPKDLEKLNECTEGWPNLYVMHFPSGKDPADFTREQLQNIADGI